MRDVSQQWELDEALRWLAVRAARACDSGRKQTWSLDDIAAARRVARELPIETHEPTPAHTREVT